MERIYLSFRRIEAAAVCQTSGCGPDHRHSLLAACRPFRGEYASKIFRHYKDTEKSLALVAALLKLVLEKKWVAQYLDSRALSIAALGAGNCRAVSVFRP